MKAEQERAPFAPITITLETFEEANAFWGMAESASAASGNVNVRNIAIKLSNWFSHHAKL